ncbi:MAG: hypothetical protein DRQ52_04035 [Gammaproteobacteria bacterium]|nr:MAG: hypothetical protein DRQ52_04035 [Gammaproteobacteria bacterium]
MKTLVNLGRFGLALLLVVSLAACGFHLRGAVDLPPVMAVTYIENNGVDAELVKRLRRSLQANKMVVTTDRTEATAVLRLLNDRYDRRILSVARGNRVSEYELHYSIRFELAEVGGGQLIAPKNIQLFRDYTYDQDEVLGKENEEKNIRKDMIREAASRVLRTIQVALSNSN